MSAGSQSLGALTTPGATTDPRWRRGALVALGLIAVALAYLYTHWTFPLVPGARAEAPLGWWAWDDQREYLKGARALLRGDLDPSQHLYPPLYPLIGALFLKIAPGAPFFWPNLALTLAYFALFVSLFARYLGAPAAVVCAGLGMIAYPDLRVQWLMPWTTTPAAVLILAALALLDRAFRARSDEAVDLRQSTLNAGAFGLMLGLLAADRPVDVAVVAPLWLAYAGMVALDAPRRGLTASSAVAAAGVGGVALAAVPYLLFNLASYGTVLGRYVAHNSAMGFDPSVLPGAVYAHLIASAPLFAEAHADWASRLPLVLAAMMFLPASLFWGPAAFRLVAACGLIEFAIYYSDHDIVPTGTFRFCNIHYFKWLAPVALALAFHAVRALASPAPVLRRRAALTLASVAALALLAGSLSPQAQEAPASVQADSGDLSIALPGTPVDYVDLSGVEGAWGAIYFPRGASVAFDGAPLVRIRDWRFLPTPGGLRILLPGRPSPHRLTVRLGEGVSATPGRDLQAVAGRLRWTLRWPRWGA